MVPSQQGPHSLSLLPGQVDGQLSSGQEEVGQKILRLSEAPGEEGMNKKVQGEEQPEPWQAAVPEVGMCQDLP